MKGFEFHCAKSQLVEPGASARLGELSKGLGCTSIFLVTDKGVADCGLLTGALRGLDEAGIAVTIYSDVQADPPAHIVEAAAEQARASGADGVIGLGGGSSLDVAKLVALLAKGEERLDAVYGVGNVRGKRLPLILVPTTAGTGSEVTPISIVTTGEGEKKGVVSHTLLPDWAVLDAELTLGLPPAITAATGIDAMVHAIEAFTSKRLKNPLSDALARQALQLLAGNIRKACDDGSNLEARQAMLLGSMYAGLAFANSPVGGVHALAYPIGALFHVPHGLSNSLVLPWVLRFNQASAGSLYAEVAEIVVPGGGHDVATKAQALENYFRDLARDLNLPVRLSEVGITANDLSRLAEDAMKQTRLLINNPREITHDDAVAIYSEAL